ncbi:MAG TPA: hypothetical protein VIG42_08135 [Solirubrobacteraceae bacterium]|jgi:hypothetical protein
MAHLQQPTFDRDQARRLGGRRIDVQWERFAGYSGTGEDGATDGPPGVHDEELAAREALRAQVGRLERELSALIAHTFPHIPSGDRGGESFSGPRLLTLAELERLRDRLVRRVGEVHREVEERTALERRSRELLRRMRLEPGRYKFARVPVADLGDGHCGVWEVRPRLGPIGMLAGWWQVKLSSGCP